MPRSWPPRGRTRGQALAEFAIVLPVFLLLLLLAADFGRLFYSYISVTNAARESAGFAAIRAADDPFDSTAFVQGARDVALAEANVQGQGGEGTLSVTAPDCFSNPANPGASTVDCSTAADFAGGIGNWVRVTVSQDFTFLTPLISAAFGGGIALSSTATAPVHNPPVAPPTPAPTLAPGSLLISKVLAGDLTEFDGGTFEFDVACDGDAFGPVSITVPDGSDHASASPISGIPDGSYCIVTETDKPNAGPHADWDNPASEATTITTGLQANVTITNTRTYSPPGPSPTPTPTPTPTPGPCVAPVVQIIPISVTDNKQTLTVNFTGISTGTPVLWRWNFGDGTQDTGQTTRHQFNYTLGPKGSGPQMWTVTLTVTTSNGPSCTGSTTATVTLDW